MQEKGLRSRTLTLLLPRLLSVSSICHLFSFSFHASAVFDKLVKGKSAENLSKIVPDRAGQKIEENEVNLN